LTMFQKYEYYIRHGFDKEDALALCKMKKCCCKRMRETHIEQGSRLQAFNAEENYTASIKEREYERQHGGL